MKYLLASAALLTATGSTAFATDHLSERTQLALTHVIAHEIGHAFLREFDIPILGPEEAIADDFATVYINELFPDRAVEIISARAEQNFADGENSDIFSEYLDDDDRAGRSICLLYGLEPDKYTDLRTRYEINDKEAESCRDFGPEVGRSWRRMLRDYVMPEGARVTEVRLTGDDIPMTKALAGSQLGQDTKTMLRHIDWHSMITLAILECDGGAGFSRNGRRITLCHSYIEKFEEQLGDN